MISSGLLVAGLVVVAVAAAVIVILVRALRRPRGADDRGIGATLPSGAVLNPSSGMHATPPAASADPGAMGTRTSPEFMAGATVGPQTSPLPDADTGAAAGSHIVPNEVLTLVADGRVDEAVTALMAATGRHEPEWARRAVDGLSRSDVRSFLRTGGADPHANPADDGVTRTTSTSSTTVSWSSTASRRHRAEPAAPEGTTASSFSAKLPDEIIALVQQGRTAEAETRIRSELGIGADQARHVVETIAKLGTLF
ncbi:hypothetical protein LXM50_10150 [Microbacterium sp. Au-Mic1]|uniref:hypothetical protein n=1 Tax=Microbacterium sp. Au-Mic1 TaxID=2906457 RepID=UPI001E2CCD12|nr:hypothetical protein [Microbacterium sp. Au-Mic1]MCE4026330.1 hypothetical protein [Microbacterium sp. Au-Mic1]